MNIWDIILLAVIAAVIVLAIRKIHIDRKRGTSCLGCSGDCAGCGQNCGSKYSRSGGDVSGRTNVSADGSAAVRKKEGKRP